MRSSTSSSLALLAISLLVGDALAAPLQRRDEEFTTVILTETLSVLGQNDGSYTTLTYLPDIPAPPTTTAAPPTTATPAPATSTTEAAPAVKVAEAVAEPAAPVTTAAPIVLPSTSVSLPSVVVPPVSVAPVASTSPSTLSSGSGKRGLAYNAVNLLEGFTGGAATWCYDWGQQWQSCPVGPFVPMLHDMNGATTASWSNNANDAIAKGTEMLLSLNEPDMPISVGGSDTSPQAAAAAHIQYMNPFKGKAVIASPAVSSSEGTGVGIDWLKQWISDCDGGCVVDRVAFHWYGASDQAQIFQEYVTEMCTLAAALPGSPQVIITEYGVAGTQPPDVHAAFIEATTPFLDSQTCVDKYAYFFVDGSLTTNGAINEAGKAFIS